MLAITSAQISDTGKYVCVAVNAAGEQQRDIDLRVYGNIITNFHLLLNAFCMVFADSMT